MLSGQENPKVVAGWIELDYFRRPRRSRRLRFWAIVGALVVSAVLVILISLPRSRAVYQASPVSTAHALFENSCEQCHVARFQTGRRLWSADEQVRSVEDSTCLRCHEAPAHHEEASQTLTCVNCHGEHRGRIKLAQVADGQCTFCHGDLRTKTGQSKFHRNIHAFSSDHPDFKARPNTARIRFNHKKHLELHEHKGREEFAAAFRRLKELGCAYCHEQTQVLGPLTPDPSPPQRGRGEEAGPLTPDPSPPKRGRGEQTVAINLEQRYPSPLNYDRHCAACHPLRAGLPEGPTKDQGLDQDLKEFAGRQILHPRSGETAQVVRDQVRGRLLELMARHPALASAEPAGPTGSRLPGRLSLQPVTGKEEAWTERQRHEIERELFDGAGGCRYCHQERSARGPGGLPDYAEPEIPTRWFTHGQFHHAAHRSLHCTECHAMQTSERTGDVRMPAIDNCKSCHSPAGGVRSDCILCHTYHDRSGYHNLVGKLTIDELKGK